MTASRPPGTLHDRIKRNLRRDMTNAALFFKATLLDAARATADFYLAHSCADGIPMWDTGAPNLHRLGNYLEKRSDPFNKWEPVDSSAAAIAAQGLLRLGNYLLGNGDKHRATRYRHVAQAAVGIKDGRAPRRAHPTSVMTAWAAASVRTDSDEETEEGRRRGFPAAADTRGIVMGVAHEVSQAAGVGASRSTVCSRPC